MTLVGVSTMGRLYFCYAKPYSQAQQTYSGEQGTLASGETLLALSYGLPLIIAGILVWLAVKKFYARPEHSDTHPDRV